MKIIITTIIILLVPVVMAQTNVIYPNPTNVYIGVICGNTNPTAAYYMYTKTLYGMPIGGWTNSSTEMTVKAPNISWTILVSGKTNSLCGTNFLSWSSPTGNVFAFEMGFPPPPPHSRTNGYVPTPTNAPLTITGFNP